MREQLCFLYCSIGLELGDICARAGGGTNCNNRYGSGFPKFKQTICSFVFLNDEVKTIGVSTYHGLLKNAAFVGLGLGYEALMFQIFFGLVTSTKSFGDISGFTPADHAHQLAVSYGVVYDIN